MPAVVVLLVRSIGVTWLCVVAPALAPLPAAPLPAPGVVARLSTGTSVSSLVLEQPASGERGDEWRPDGAEWACLLHGSLSCKTVQMRVQRPRVVAG